MKVQTKLKRDPQPAKGYAGEAWFYEKKNRIDICIEGRNGLVLHARIRRKQLADWIKRTEPQP